MASISKFVPGRFIMGLVLGHALLAGLASCLAWGDLAFEIGWSVESLRWALARGIPFGQATLLGCWTVIGSGRRAIRAILSLLALLLLWATVFVIQPLVRHRFDSATLVPGLALLGQSAVVLLIQCFLRCCFVWNLPAKGGPGTAEPDRPWQFGIRHLMVWTTVTALLLVLGRELMPHFTNMPEAYAFTLFGVANCAFSTPLLVLAERERGWLAGLLLSVVWLIAVTLGEIQVFLTMWIPVAIRERIWLVNGVQFTVIVGTMWSIRVAQQRQGFGGRQSP